MDNVHVDLPWKVCRSVLVTFKAASIARPLTARLVPVASRRVLSPRGWLLPHSRGCRGRSRVSGVVVTGYRPPLKANDTPFGVSQLQEASQRSALHKRVGVEVVEEFASGGRHAMGCW